MKFKQAQRVVRERERLMQALATVDTRTGELTKLLEAFDDVGKIHRESVARATSAMNAINNEWGPMGKRHEEELRALKHKHTQEREDHSAQLAVASTYLLAKETELNAYTDSGKALRDEQARLPDERAAIEMALKLNEKDIKEAQDKVIEIGKREQERVANEEVRARIRAEVRKQQAVVSPIILSLPKTLSDPLPSHNRKSR